MIILVILLVIFLWIIYTRIFGAEFVRTPKYARTAALKMLKLNKRDVFYDLGAGVGSLLLEASPKVKKAIGIEIDPIRFLISYLRIKARKAKNAKLILGNIFDVPLNNSTKIFLFLSKETNVKLARKLKKESKAIVISYKWPVKNLKLIGENEKYRLYKHKI